MKYIFFKVDSTWRVYRSQPFGWLFVRSGSDFESRLVHRLNDHIFHDDLDADTPDHFVERLVRDLNYRILRKLETITITENYEVIFNCYD